MNGGSEAELRGTRHTLVTVLEGLLRLAHPIIPFITETIWQRVKAICGITADTIMLQPFPQYDASQVDDAALADTEWLKQAIVAVRNIRAEMNIAPGKPLELLLRGCSKEAERRVNDNRSFLLNLARLESITVLPADDKGPVSVTKIVDGAELLIPMAGLINKEDELARLAKEVAKIEGEIGRIESKLANEGFVARAPEAVIAKEREKLEGYAEAKAKLIEQQAVIAALDPPAPCHPARGVFYETSSLALSPVAMLLTSSFVFLGNESLYEYERPRGDVAASHYGGRQCRHRQGHPPGLG